MNITHSNGFILNISIYISSGEAKAFTKYRDIEGYAITYSKHGQQLNYKELVNEAIEDFCIQWVQLHKHSNIMNHKWIVIGDKPGEYVAISL